MSLSSSSGRSLQISESGSEDDPLDKELEEMFNRKHSLTIDERIAHKQEKQSRNAALILSTAEDADTNDFSSSIACLPDYETTDSAPFAYTVNEASTAAELYDQRLSQRTESDEDSKEQQSEEFRLRRQSLTLDEHDIAQKKKKDAIQSQLHDGEDLSSSIAHLPDYEPTDSAPLSYTLDEASKKMGRIFSFRYSIDGALDSENSECTAAATNGEDVSDYSDRRVKQFQRRARTFEDRIQSKIVEATKENQPRILHRRTICYTRPGITHVPLPPSQTKEDKTESDARDLFEDRLLLKLSQGSTRSLPARALPARSQSDVTYDHFGASSKSSRSELTNASRAAETSWACNKCTFLNDFRSQSESIRTCKMCHQPHVTSKSAKKERPKMPKSSSSERVLRSDASALHRTKIVRRKTHHASPSVDARETKQQVLQWSDLKSAIDEAIVRSKELSV